MKIRFGTYESAKTNAVVISTKQAWFQSSNKPAISILSLVLVAMVIVPALYWWHNETSNAAANITTSDNAAYKNVLGHAQQYDNSGKFKDETTALKKYLATKPPKQFQYKPLMMLGLLAYDSRNDKTAIQYYQQAVAANGGKLTEGDAETIGQAAAAEGNKTLALEYFKKAIQLTDTSSGTTNDLGDLKATVKNLESQQ